jgi:hypothetical protein
MPNQRSRQGKAAELQVVGLLTDASLDCYLTVVDDQGIDVVIRIDRPDSPRYFDVQVKSGRNWQAIRGSISALGKRKNALLILFNSSERELLWLDSAAISRRFPATGSSWGDVFLNAPLVQELRDEGRDNLMRLREYLEK